MLLRYCLMTNHVSAQLIEGRNTRSCDLLSALLLYILGTLATCFIMMSLKKLKCWQNIRSGIPPIWLVCIGLGIVQIGFGIYPIVIKMFANSPDAKANPLVLSFYRDVCCTPVLFLCALIAERKFLVPSVGMLLLFIICGFAGMFGNQYLYILGVYNSGPSVASVFQPIIPVWTSILALLTCTEKPSSFKKIPIWAKFLGILLAAGGAIEIMTTGPSSGNGGSTNVLDHTLGYVALLGNTFCMAIYVLLQKRFIFDKPNNKWKDYPISVTAYSYFFGAVFMGLCSLQYVGTPENRALFAIPWQSVYVLIYATFVTSALCYLLITWANSQVSSILVTAFWPLQVLVSVIGSWIFLGIEFYPLQYIGAVMLIMGLFLVLWSSYLEDRLKEGRGGFILDKLTIDVDFGCIKLLKKDKGEQQPLVGAVNRVVRDSKILTPSPDLPIITSKTINSYNDKSITEIKNDT